MDSRFQKDCMELLVEETGKGRIGRRDFVKAMSALLAVPLVLRSKMAYSAADRLVICNWGGDAIKAYAEAFGKAFTEATGIPVRIDGAGPTEGAIQAQYESGNVTWDVVDADAFTSLTLGRKGMMEPIDYSIVDKAAVREGGAHEYGAASYFFSYVLAYDTEAYGDNPPKSWADFFDAEAFPGKRTMYKWMVGNLEAALIADGVKPEELYPLDVDRAFEKLKAFLPHVVSFWGSGAASQQLLMEGEAQMGLVWNTRAMVMERDTEGQIAFTFDGGLLNASSWAVIKGNPAGPKTAMEFIASAQNPEQQVTLLKLLGNGPANPAAAALVPDELKKYDCTQPDNVAVQHMLDAEWYADNYGATLDKFLTLISG